MTWNIDNGYKILEICVTISSLIASLAMSYFCFKNLSSNKICLKILMYLGIADFLYSFSNFLSFFESKENLPVEPLCYFEATLRLWSWRFSLILATSIAVLSYKRMACPGAFDQRKFFKNILCFSFLLILPLNLAALFPDASKVQYLNSDMMCLIYYDQGSPHADFSTKLTITTLYDGVFCGACILTTLISYILSIRIIKRIDPIYQNQIHVSTKKLLCYPVALIISFLPNTINAYYKVFNSESIQGLLIPHILLNHSIGLINAIVYGYQRRVYQKLSLEGDKSGRQVEGQVMDLEKEWSLSVKKELLGNRDETNHMEIF